MSRVVASDRELGRHRCFFRPGAHEPSLRPAAERQAQRVQQDRLAGAGLAGQHAQPRVKGERQPIDQHDIADSQTEQHAANDTGSGFPCGTGKYREMRDCTLNRRRNPVGKPLLLQQTDE